MAPPVDGFGLPLTTTSASAAAWYRRGVAELLDGRPGAATSFARSVGADRRFALGLAGVAVATSVAGDGQPAVALTLAGELAHGATRRERQHVEVLAAILGSDSARAVALAREHLAEFPSDAVVAHMLGNA